MVLHLFSSVMRVAETGMLPDFAVQFGFRKLLKQRLKDICGGHEEARNERLRQFLADCRSGPVAIVPELASEQHYEVPAEFFRTVLGSRLKYSCCHFPDAPRTLDEAEESALMITCERAGIEDGMDILEHGSRFVVVSLLTVFALQGVVMWIVSLPLQTTGNTDVDSLWLKIIGTVLWLTGLFFETAGDWQLARFRNDPGNAGRVLDSGLWRYTRHPNYIGDFCVWWGLFLVAIGCGAHWWTVLGPAIMSVFLMRFSGVGLLEKSLRQSKPGYAEYTAKTNPFFPWFPGQSALDDS